MIEDDNRFDRWMEDFSRRQEQKSGGKVSAGSMSKSALLKNNSNVGV